MKSPVKPGSNWRMRASSGGCEAKRLLSDAPGEKSRCASSLRLAHRIALPKLDAPIRLSAPANPDGLRVNCTAEASAKNSRWRDTEA